MNNLKKLVALVLSVVLLLSLSSTALAQEGDGAQYCAVVRFAPEADAQELCEALEELPGVRVRWQYSALFRGAAIEGTRASLALAGKQGGVSALSLSRTWTKPSTITNPTYPSNSLDVMNGLDCAYDGDGIVVAVLDSGMKISHEAFADYGVIDNIRLTQEDIEEFVDNGGTEGRYLSVKVPFVYDYSGQDRSVHTADPHGTHVAALAVGYVPRADGSVKFQGAASAAQLLCMKVFPDDAKEGADDVDILKAMEDAYLLGADVINLSLGVTDAFLADARIGEVYSDVIATLEAEGVVVCCAVGNFGTALSGKPGDTALPSGGYTDYASACAPAIYDGAQAIAAVGAAFYEAGGGILAGERTILYTEMVSEVEDAVLPDIRALMGQEMPYVLIDGVGSAEDFAGLDLTGCVAVVPRGTIYFSEKANNAAAAGAELCIIYNNEPGFIIPAADGLTIPCVMITQEDGAYLVEQAENGRGVLAVAPEMMRISTGEGMKMLSYSSWGATPDLRLTPTLSAPGGTILSAGMSANDAYDYLSGTSMATPNASGAYAVVLQALRERGVEDHAQRLQLATALLESTATQVTDENGVPLSPRRQGAGVIDLNAALQTEAVITDPILSLGESETGRFSISFTVKNLSDHEKTFRIDTTVLTDASVVAEGAVRNALKPLDITEQVMLSGMQKITVAPMGERTVTLTLVVPLRLARILQQTFPNGFFTEGYVTLTDEQRQSVHATFMGYYGDWEKAPILDSVDFRAVMDAYYADSNGDTDALATLVADMGYNYACLCGADLDTYGARLPGENPWLVTRAHDVRHAMSTVQSDAIIRGGEYLVIDLYTLRNAEHLIFVVSDQQTGEIYCVDDRAYLEHSAIIENAGMAAPATRFVWDGRDRNGTVLPSGTAVTVAFYAWLETETQFSDRYEAHRTEWLGGNYDWLLNGDFEACNEWSFPLVLDAITPQVQWSTDTAGECTITVTDEHCVAYVAVQDENGQYLAEESYAEERIGVSHVLSVPWQEESAERLYITVADYAGNVAGYEIKNGSLQRCPVAMLTDVEKDVWYHEAVDFVVTQNWMKIGEDLTFSPQQGALRISVLEVLYRLAGAPQVPQGTVVLPFQDVPAGASYRAMLEWAYSVGIVNGYDASLFGAYAPIQRAQLAAMLWRAALVAGEDVTCDTDVLQQYADVDTIPAWAEQPIAWAMGQGYLSPDGEGAIASTAYVTRAEFAYLLWLFHENNLIEDNTNDGMEEDSNYR